MKEREAATIKYTLRETNNILLFLAILGIIMAAVGGYGLALRFSKGLTFTNLTTNLPYGLYVVLYIFWIGCSAGGVSVSSLIDFLGKDEEYPTINRIALWSSWIALVIGLAFIALDLGRVESFYYIYLTYQPSSILWWESMFYLLYFAVLSAKVFLIYRGKVRKVLRALSIASIPIALIGVHAGTGAIFASISAIPYWYGPLLPVIFIVSALVSGSALVNWLSTFIAPHDEREFTKTLAKYFILPVLCLDAFLIFIEFAFPFYNGHTEHILIYKEILFGSRFYVFWSHIALGLVLPFVILIVKKLRDSLRWVSLASFLLFAVTFCVRWNIIIPPMKSHSELSHIGKVTYYVPTMMEWLSSLSVLGIFVFVFAIGGFVFFRKGQDKQ